MKHVNLFLLFQTICLFTAAAQSYTYSYGSAVTTEEARRIIPTPDGNYLIVGYSTPRLDSLNREGLVMKITPAGHYSGKGQVVNAVNLRKKILAGVMT